MLNKSSKIAVIGAGKVAHTLVPLLIEKHYAVKGIISRSRKPAAALAKKLKLDFYADKFNIIPPEIEVFLIMVPDNQIAVAAEHLYKIRSEFNGCLFIHTSGSEASSVLKILEDKGAMTASFHIMQTFPSIKQTRIKNSFAAVETKYKQAEKYLFSTARNLGLKSFKLTAESKVYYHMAGVFAANFINANYFSAEKLLSKTGLKDRDNLFEPILRMTLNNIQQKGSWASLSGPIQRGDSHTVKKHIDALTKKNSRFNKKLLQSYVAQCMILLELIKEGEGKLNAGQKEIKKILRAARSRV